MLCTAEEYVHEEESHQSKTSAAFSLILVKMPLSSSPSLPLLEDFAKRKLFFYLCLIDLIISNEKENLQLPVLSSSLSLLPRFHCRSWSGGSHWIESHPLIWIKSKMVDKILFEIPKQIIQGHNSYFSRLSIASISLL